MDNFIDTRKTPDGQRIDKRQATNPHDTDTIYQPDSRSDMHQRKPYRTRQSQTLIRYLTKLRNKPTLDEHQMTKGHKQDGLQTEPWWLNRHKTDTG
jgi:hypothetical protein